MFEQSLLSKQNGARTRGRWAMVLSFVLQCLVIGVLILVPLIYTNVLPAAAMRQYFAAPPPPPGPPPPSVVKVVHTEIKKTFNPPDDKLYQPPSIPKDLPPPDEPPTLPPVAECRGCVPGGDPQGVPFGVPYGLPPVTPPVSLPPPKVEAPKPATPPRIRVGGNVQKANLVSAPKPVYPALARQARIQGTVKLNAVINKDGAIEQLTVVSGHPLLIPAALEAVSKWRYKPTLLNGEPVEVLTQIDVNFTLSM